MTITASVKACRTVTRGEKDPVEVRPAIVAGRPIIEVLDVDGDVRFWIPGEVHVLPDENVDEIVRALADQQDEHTRRCIDIGKRRKEHELRQVIGAAPMEVF